MMKKLFLPFFALTFVLVAAGILIFQTGSPKSSSLFYYSEIVYILNLVIMFSLGIFFWIKRTAASSEGLPVDDELSRQVIHKAGLASFFLSYLLWLIGLILYLGQIVDPRLLFALGFSGSSLIFIVSWFYYNYQGMGNA